MARGRNWYSKHTFRCACGWTGKRTRFQGDKPCPRCGKRPKEVTARADADRSGGTK